VVQRNESPGNWQDPLKYKPSLRRLFAYTCAYSWVHESLLGGAKTFEVEHLRPEGDPRFERLRCVYSNLYYVWGPCNRAKGVSWPTAAQEAAGFRYVDPCNESAFEHFGFELDGGSCTGRFVGYTNAGRYTILKCALNNDVLREIRRRVAAIFLEERERLRQLNLVLNGESLTPVERDSLENVRRSVFDRIVDLLNPKPLPPDDPSGGAERPGASPTLPGSEPPAPVPGV
jgi:hypothetical protein